VPAWRRGQAAGEWREIAGSSLNLQVPTNIARTTAGGSAVVGAAARMDAWCGLSIDTRSSKVWSLANGGHGDYYGNEVCTIDLMADSPAWAEWFAGSSGNVIQTNDDVPDATSPSYARYLDGLPSSRHSYYGQQFLERQNRALTLGGSVSPRGSAFENVEGFDVTRGRGVNAWDAAGTFGFAVGGTSGGWTPAIGWSACKDPTTECIYTITIPYIRKFTPGTTGIGGTWSILSALPSSMNSGALGATAVDTRRRRLLWVRGYGPDAAMVCNLATGAWSENAHPASEAKAEFEALTQSLGLIYVPQIDKFLARANAAGSKVYVIDPVTFAVTYLTTTGGDAVPRGAVLSNEEGVYNRWLYVPALSGVAYFPKSASNAWFLRVY
jgi:hypothetical protein